MPARALSGIITVCLVATVGCSRPLPEEPGPDAALYREKCGICHQAFQPALLTAAMWRTQVERMAAAEMKRAAVTLSEGDKQRLLAYLTRNAAGR